MIYTSSYPERVYPDDLSTYKLLFDNKKNIAQDKVIYVDTENTSKFYTYSQTHAQVLKTIAGWKREFNFKKGDVVAFCSINHIDYPIALIGTVCAGGIAAAIDHGSTAEKIASDLDLAQAKFLVAHVETLEKALAAAKIYGLPESNILIFGETGAADTIRCVDDTLLSGEELGTPIEYTKEEIKNNPAFLYFTSGTTGTKKAVMITQYSLCSSIHMNDWPYNDSNILSYTEFHHVSALLTTMHLPLYFGSTSFIMAHYSLRNFCAAIQNHQIHMTTTQPYIISALANDSISKEYDLSSLRGVVCGGAALDNSITRLAKEKLNLAVLNVYAMTECLGGMATNPAVTLANGTGYLASGFTARLVDEDGNDVPEGETGELWLKGPASAIGYYRNPEATAQTFDSDGYVHTGDLFKRNQDGLFTYVDRSKDLIKYLLHHIYPNEIEKVIMTHPAVLDCAVIGIYNSKLATELPRAYVELVEGEFKDEVIESELLEYANSQLPDPKRLRGGVVIVNSFPRTPFGKIQRRLLQGIGQTGRKVTA